ncbi:exosome complex component RRP43 [Rhodotorula toruloides]|uniref:Ribosomal RNA-processing protein 43 n=1 Tax=Rhodotorula toruloides TaxID=5286 RepID=A0A511KFK8_RHOTO|nr:exosome complex component RRP43 [Rhodotorula toruloides]
MAVQAAPSNLTPALFRSLFPQPYLERFISQGVRPDGRPVGEQAAAADSWRDVSVNIGSVSTAPSSALVRLGKTSVVCGVTLEIAPPDLARPNEGFIVPNVDLSPLCSPLFRPGPPPDEAQVLSSRLRDALLSSNSLPLSSLVIEPGKAVWVVYIDVVCLNYDGGVLDAAVLAAVGALRSLRFPETTFDIDTSEVICEEVTEEHPGTRISGPREPFSVSFGVFNGTLLPNPTSFESKLCSSEITIVVGAPTSSSTATHAETPLLRVYQAGGPLENGKEVLRRCIEMARVHAEELQQSLV